MVTCLPVLAAALQVLSGEPVPQQTGLRDYAVDASTSAIYVVTRKEGLFSFLGHEHAIVPTAWEGSLCLGDPIAEGSQGSLVLQAGSLVVDSDSARDLAGLGHGPSENDVRKIQGKMLDADHLAVDQYPEIRINVVALETTEGGRVQARAALDLHGVTRQAEFPVAVEVLGQGRLRLSGALSIRQSDFGIKPESIAGVVKVKDGVELHFALVAVPTGLVCGGSGNGSGDGRGVIPQRLVWIREYQR